MVPYVWNFQLETNNFLKIIRHSMDYSLGMSQWTSDNNSEKMLTNFSWFTVVRFDSLAMRLTTVQMAKQADSIWWSMFSAVRKSRRPDGSGCIFPENWLPFLRDSRFFRAKVVETLQRLRTIISLHISTEDYGRGSLLPQTADDLCLSKANSHTWNGIYPRDAFLAPNAISKLVVWH